MQEIFLNFKNKHILIVGDIILDRYIIGKVSRISPEAPVPIVEVTDESYRLGGAANVANNIVALGGKVDLAGTIGKDKEGESVKEQCLTKGIGCDSVIQIEKNTTVKTRIIAHNQQVVRFDKEDTRKINRGELSKLIDVIQSNKDKYDGVIISDYKKGIVSEKLVREIVRSFKDKFVAVDPKVGNFSCYTNTSIITPNKKEASEGSSIDIIDEKTLIKAGKELINKLHLQALLITRGEEGMSLFQKDKKTINITHIPATAKKVFDVTGAGDTVIAVFCLTYLSGASMEDSARIANYAAGIVVGQVGTATVTIDELLKTCQGL
ncbi:MAG: D-glycero-beta-D-manno-heptose-7-phosphate kinase [Thermodesulfovibrionales bacterium]|nr:D-glycero-beta-D-manno-heptose-7-phosphate kinase [Thermodesulfovibrionales bacterium]